MWFIIDEQSDAVLGASGSASSRRAGRYEGGSGLSGAAEAGFGPDLCATRVAEAIECTGRESLRRIT
jgi:hypothetical protein